MGDRDARLVEDTIRAVEAHDRSGERPDSERTRLEGRNLKKHNSVFSANTVAQHSIAKQNNNVWECCTHQRPEKRYISFS